MTSAIDQYNGKSQHLDLYVREFVVYPMGRENSAELPLFVEENGDLHLAYATLEGRRGGSQDGLVVIALNADDSSNEVLYECSSRDYAAFLTRAIDQLTVARDQILRLQSLSSKAA